MFAHIVIGHVVNPLVAHCVLLEHGCEKHHNDSVSADMKRYGVDTSKFGWASVQVDGGIRKVSNRCVFVCVCARAAGLLAVVGLT